MSVSGGPRVKARKPAARTGAEPEAAAKPVRRRRPGAEVRQLILQAARRLFAERGYPRTSTRAIAESAGVTEVLLFRHFQSKADLFREAVAEPLEDLIHAFNARNAATPGMAEAKGHSYVLELFKLLSSERGLVLALIADRTFGSAQDEENLPGMPTYFADSAAYLRKSYQVAGLEPTLPPELGARIAFATVVAGALFQDWMFKDIADPEHLKQAIADYVLYGLFGKPPQGG